MGSQRESQGMVVSKQVGEHRCIGAGGREAASAGGLPFSHSLALLLCQAWSGSGQGQQQHRQPGQVVESFPFSHPVSAVLGLEPLRLPLLDLAMSLMPATVAALAAASSVNHCCCTWFRVWCSGNGECEKGETLTAASSPLPNSTAATAVSDLFHSEHDMVAVVAGVVNMGSPCSL